MCCESEDKVSQGFHELSSHDCGKFVYTKAIGGTEIKLMSRPWMALLKFRTSFDTEEFTCGGTLIHKSKLTRQNIDNLTTNSYCIFKYLKTGY